MDCVIVGAGAAGMQAAMTCRERWPGRQITVFDTEPEVGYYRTLIPQFINHTLPEEKLFFWHRGDDHHLSVRQGISVETVDRENRQLLLSDGQRFPYKKLIIATGGRPIVPPVCLSQTGPGVFPVRSLSVARSARSWLQDNPEVVILGGGLVGVKMAAHLAGYNIRVTLVERESQLLPLALSPEAARLIEKHLENRGIELVLGQTVTDLKFSNGVLKAVETDGRWIDCRTLFIAAGSVPELGFLQDSGLIREGSLEVTTDLRTDDNSIWAAGDVVTIVDGERSTPWTWPQAVAQGRLAALNLYAPGPLRLQRLSRANAMNLDGLSLAVIGAPVGGAEHSIFVDSEKNVYREIYHLGGRIVGGALLGDITGVGRLHQAMAADRLSRAELDDLLVPCSDAFTRSPAKVWPVHRRALLLNNEGVG